MFVPCLLSAVSGYWLCLILFFLIDLYNNRQDRFRLQHEKLNRRLDSIRPIDPAIFTAPFRLDLCSECGGLHHDRDKYIPQCHCHYLCRLCGLKDCIGHDAPPINEDPGW